jgi:Tfp pilus assembly protein PilF
MSVIANLEKMLFSGQDNAMLRFGLGSAYMQQNDCHGAIPHLESAVQHDPGYSAAWKLLGKAHTACGQPGEAKLAYEKGIDCAEKKGDLQAVKEMQVFLRRIEKS